MELRRNYQRKKENITQNFQWNWYDTCQFLNVLYYVNNSWTWIKANILIESASTQSYEIVIILKLFKPKRGF